MFKFWLKYKILRLCKNDRRKKRFLSLDKIQTVLVIFEATDYDAAHAFIKQLEQMKKKVTVYCYKTSENKNNYSKTSYHLISNKTDIDRLGFPRRHLSEDLRILDQYDLLVDLTLNENMSIEYLVALSGIPLKVGLKKNEFPLYDFSISNLPDSKNKHTISELGKQILHYLNTIQSVE